jgi:hypothetical protein
MRYKDHLDMKSGFKPRANDGVELHAEQASLFANVRPQVLRQLVGGFGANCGAWFADEDGNVPHYIDRATLEARCSTKPGELPAILTRIEEML